MSERTHASPQQVKGWVRNTRPNEASTIALYCEDIGGGALVCEWNLADLADVDEWAASVCELAKGDAHARGASQRYTLRHMRDDRLRGQTWLRIVVRKTKEEEADEREGATYDGSVVSILSQLQRSNDRAQAQLLQMAQMSIEGQKAALALLGQCYQHIGQLQARNAELHEAANPPQLPSRGADEDPMRLMLQTVGPHIANALAEKLLGSDFFDDNEPAPMPKQ